MLRERNDQQRDVVLEPAGMAGGLGRSVEPLTFAGGRHEWLAHERHEVIEAPRAVFRHDSNIPSLNR